MKASITPNKTLAAARLRSLLRKAAVLVFWLLVWQAAYLAVDRELYLPGPLAVLLRLAELVRLKAFWVDTLHSVVRVAEGFALSMALAVLLGVLSGLSGFVHTLLSPLVTAIKATPVMSFIMIALFWFSSGQVPVFVCFLMCFPIVWTPMVEGIRNVDGQLLEMSRMFRVHLRVRIRRLYIPSLLPFFTPACLNALGFGWKVGVAAEVLSHPARSIGSHLYEAKAYLDSAELFAWTVVVIALSMGFEKLFAYLIRRLPAGKREVLRPDA
ncbi:ABC transporter permease [Paenibacillus sp. YN15]|uniref:ABC transporter permease n=1 Tax=Paenibacillus sp. YN15 TaxID=1742774 RepID=UPI000DCEF7C8|nr:ABC transporter permease subunit [Paenibacillus sp. YN15]RAV01024.1 ABC transporter permease [Paenibacillus sp. YN15]